MQYHFKRRLIVFSVIILFLIFVQILPADDLVKVGIIDIKRIFEEYSYTKTAASQLRGQLEEEQKKIREREKALLQEEEGLKGRELLLTEEEKKKQRDELENKKKELKLYADDVSRRIARKNDELTKGIISDITKVLKEIGVKEGYTFILEKNNVLYASEDIDITDEVIRILNERKGQ